MVFIERKTQTSYRVLVHTLGFVSVSFTLLLVANPPNFIALPVVNFAFSKLISGDITVDVVGFRGRSFEVGSRHFGV